MEGFPGNTPAIDTKMDVDVSKPTEPHRLDLNSDPGSIPTLDGWIESLMSCKQLSENDVARLCDRVSVRDRI
jgi:serine/threonine-protein phosphatase 2A catalytic subunit